MQPAGRAISFCLSLLSHFSKKVDVGPSGERQLV
jgi:hypothetical protein